MIKRGKTFLIVAALILGLWLLVTYSSTPERSRKPSADWGRGVPIGSDASGTLGVVVDEDGSAIHVVWPFEAADGIGGIRYVQLGETAQTNIEREVIKIEGQMRSPRLFAAENDFFHLLWVNRVDTTRKWQLWYVQIDREGNLQGDPMQISDPGSGVLQYAVARTQNNEIWIAWEDVRFGGIKLTGISAFGEEQAQNMSVAAGASNPDIVVDSQGQIHLTWVDSEDNLFYASSNQNALSSLTKEKIIYIPLGTGASLDGPKLGVSDETVYVFWSILEQSGLNAGTARTEYITFPLGMPERVSSLEGVGVLPDEEPSYQPKEGDYSYSQLVSSFYLRDSSRFVYAPSTIQNPKGELALAVAAQQQHRLNSNIQIAIVIMNEGKYKGYSFATKTQEISSDPVLAADEAGNIHLIWREGFTKEDVYYTTTDAEIRAKVDRPTLRDASTLILSGGMEGLAGILLFPLAFPWIFPGLVIVVIWRLVRNDEDLEDRISQIILVISVILYQATKLLVFPSMARYVPFSAWMDVASVWEVPLRIIVPISILGISIFVAERLRRRSKDSPSTLRYYFIVVFLDMALTLAVYGVNFLGAY
ncbi:MAG: hypothetical protein GY755_21455 [Chloroflexi bacterium]|nr:hypothetical protein [Chloroflexota bacterium]